MEENVNKQPALSRPAGVRQRGDLGEPSGGGVGSLLAALQQLLEQRVGLVAQGDRGVQLHDPPCLQHQHPIRVQYGVEPVREHVVSGGMGDNALKQKAGPCSLLSSHGQHRSTHRLYPWLSAMGWRLQIPQTMC